MNRWLKRLLPVVLIALAVVLGLATPAQGKEVYVAVQSGNQDAVIFDQPKLFGAEVVGFLETNDALEVLDEDNKTFLKVRAKDGTIGWVARNVVRGEKVGAGESTSSAGTGTSSKGLAAMGFSAEIEAGAAQNDQKLAENLKVVSELEYTVRGELTGVWQQVTADKPLSAEDARTVTANKRKAYSEFGRQGGLVGTNP